MKCDTNGFKRKYIKLDLDLILISYSIRHGLNAIRMEQRSDRVNEHLAFYEFYFLFFMEKIAAEIIHSTRVSSPDDVTIALSGALHHRATGNQSAR